MVEGSLQAQLQGLVRISAGSNGCSIFFMVSCPLRVSAAHRPVLFLMVGGWRCDGACTVHWVLHVSCTVVCGSRYIILRHRLSTDHRKVDASNKKHCQVRTLRACTVVPKNRRMGAGSNKSKVPEYRRAQSFVSPPHIHTCPLPPPHSLPGHLTPNPTHTPTHLNLILTCNKCSPGSCRSLERGQAPAPGKGAGAWNGARLLLRRNEQEPGKQGLKRALR